VIQRLRQEARPPWKDSVYDAFVFHAAMDYLKAHEPRVLYVALGDTDEWAHAGNYERYLDSVARSDRWLQELWEAVSSRPAYRGRTSLLVTTDHGRGDGPEEWGKHGAEIAGADSVWVALIGPDTPPLGERHDHEPLTLSQVAATVGALVGEDFAAASGQAAPPLPFRTATK
jgi:bisphosphoglycerate-independent phosphoglycerate mutase (AlkP superfamily)